MKLAAPAYVAALAARLFFFGLAFCGPAIAAHATVIDDFRLEGSYGSGSNRVALVVDFPTAAGDADSFAFEVRFNTETIGGLDVLNAVKAGTAGAFDYGFRLGFDNFIETMTYNTRSIYCPADTDDSLQYWVSSDAGQTWNDPALPTGWLDAIDLLSLTNNQTLGWSADAIHWQPDTVGYWYPTPSYEEWARPVVPLSQTPEPSAIALITCAIAAGGAWAWRRRAVTVSRR